MNSYSYSHTLGNEGFLDAGRKSLNATMLVGVHNVSAPSAASQIEQAEAEKGFGSAYILPGQQKPLTSITSFAQGIIFIESGWKGKYRGEWDVLL